MNLIIDEGNTRVKCAVFSHKKMIAQQTFQVFDASEIINEFKIHKPSKCIVSSTKNEASYFESFLKPFNSSIFLNQDTKTPLKNNYKTPETLGKDRLAAAVGAYSLFPKHDMLIIDAGTALTVEYIESGGTYLGGTISPGLVMRLKALNYYTKKLPLVEPVFTDNLYGENSITAIQQGVINGMSYELEGICKKFIKAYKQGKIILTGGDIVFFEKKLKNTIFVNPNLVLIGLNTILEHNAY